MFSWFGYVRYVNWVTIHKTIAGILNKRLTGLAAEMAFHAMLGIFPALIAVLTAIGFFEDSVESSLVSFAIYLADLVPIQVWTLLLDFIGTIKAAESGGWFSLSSITTIWIISGVLTAAANALEQIHEVPAIERRSYFKAKLVAICLTVLTIALFVIACFLLWVGDFLIELALKQGWNALLVNTWTILSVVLVIAIIVITSALISHVQVRMRRRNEQAKKRTIIVLLVLQAMVATLFVYGGYGIVKRLMLDLDLKLALSTLPVDLWRFLGFPLALGIVALAFALIYLYGSSVRLKNTPIFPGAVLAAISWAIVSVIFRLYVTHIGVYSKIYGALGTFIVLMLWLYLTALVMLIGEQVNVILGRAHYEYSLTRLKPAKGFRRDRW